MHSLETGIIIGIAAFFFFRFMTFTFEKEINISKEIVEKVEIENKSYVISGEKDYIPELINNLIEIIKERGELEYVGDEE